MEGAARCSICGTNFPLSYAGEQCPVCLNEELDGIKNDEPDDDWETKMNHARFERYYEASRGRTV